MNLKKIFLFLTFIMFIIDRYIDGINTNYNAWIVIFLFWIAINTANKKE